MSGIVFMPKLAVTFELGRCAWCDAEAVPVARDASPELLPDEYLATCGTCAILLGWAWRREAGEDVPDSPFSTTPKAVLVLIVRDRFTSPGVPDFACPRDVLMVERKDEPGRFGLPGGKIEVGETPAEAAVRELGEESGVASWVGGLDPLYLAPSILGNLVRTFVARAWSGEPRSMESRPDGSSLSVEWRPWPPSQHAGHMRGYYLGLEEAFEVRVRHKAETQTSVSLCGRLRKVGARWLETVLAGEAAGEDRELLSGDRSAMTGEEKETADVVVSASRRPKEAPQADEQTGRRADGQTGGPEDDVPDFQEDDLGPDHVPGDPK